MREQLIGSDTRQASVPEGRVPPRDETSPRRSGRHRDTGFTLLEVMVALAIIAIAFVALLGLRNRDIALHEYSRSLITATALAQQRIADTAMGGFPDLGQSEGAFEDEYARFRWRQDVNTTPFDAVREVRVTVLWGTVPQEEQVQLVKYLFQPKS